MAAEGRSTAEEQRPGVAYEPVRIRDDEPGGVATTLRRCSRNRKLQLMGVLAVMLVAAFAAAGAAPAKPLRQAQVSSAQQDWSLWGALFGGDDKAASGAAAKKSGAAGREDDDEGKEGEAAAGEGEKNEGKGDEGKEDDGKEDEGKEDEGKEDEGKEDDGKEDEEKEDEGKEDEGEDAEGKEDERKQDGGKDDEGKDGKEKEDGGKEDGGKEEEGKVDGGKEDEGKEDGGKEDEDTEGENAEDEGKDVEGKEDEGEEDDEREGDDKEDEQTEVLDDDEEEKTTEKTTRKATTSTTTKKTTTPRPRATAPPTTRAPAAQANPFSKRSFYTRMTHKKSYDYAIKYATGGTKDNLKRMRDVPSAFWVSDRASIKPFEVLLKDAASKSPPELVVLIWYDLPNRDCASKASTGEICCSPNEDGTCNYDDQDDCSDGIKEYKSTYADPLVSLLQEYTLEQDVPVVVVVEPDSLPNLATNADNPHCGKATAEGYKAGIKYTLEQLTGKTGADVYVDAANGGWLGWEKNMVGFMNIIKDMELPLDKVRGFTTNVAKYQPLGVMCPWESHDSGTYQNGHCLANQHADDPCCKDPCHLLGQYSPANNELNYVQKLVRAAKGVLGMEAHAVIDTSRNGWEGMGRDEKCANWCNLRGAGAGHVATTNTANTDMIDAYFWLKTPGESDGCTEELPNGDKCKRFDEECKSENSIGTREGEPKVDEAGLWDEYQVKELAANAHLGEEEVAVTV